MATTKPKPEDVLANLLQNGNVVNPQAQLDTSQWTPTYSQTPQQSAQTQADLQYGEPIRELEQASREAAIENERARQQQQAYGAEIDPRLANVYSALGTSLEQRRGETQTNYGSAIDKIRGYYDEATAAGAGVNTDILNRLTGSAERLGVGAAIPDATKQLMENYQFEQGQLSRGKAGRSANLATLASEIFGLDTSRIGASAQEGAQERTYTQQGVMNALSQLLQEGQKEQRGYRGKITGLKGDQSKAMAQLLAEIEDERKRDEIQARSSALEEMLSRSGLANQNRQFGMQEQQFGLQQQQFAEEQRQFNEQIRQAGLDRQQQAALSRASNASRSSGRPTNPLDDMLKMLKIDELSGKLNTFKGQEGLEAFLSNPNKYWGKIKDPFGKEIQSPSAGPIFRTKVELLINTANKMSRESRNSGIVKRAKGDPYQVALSLIRKPSYKTQNPAALRAAVEAYFKGFTLK